MCRELARRRAIASRHLRYMRVLRHTASQDCPSRSEATAFGLRRNPKHHAQCVSVCVCVNARLAACYGSFAHKRAALLEHRQQVVRIASSNLKTTRTIAHKSPQWAQHARYSSTRSLSMGQSPKACLHVRRCGHLIFKSRLVFSPWLVPGTPWNAGVNRHVQHARS